MPLDLYVKLPTGEMQQLSALAIGSNISPVQKVPLPDAILKYVELCTSTKCKKNQHNERKYFDKLLLRLMSFGVAHVDEVKLEHFQLIEGELLKEIKYASVLRRFSCYRDFFTKCEEWGFCYEHPMRKLKKRRLERNPHKKWSRDEFYRFLQTTDGDWRNICLFLWYTGCRVGEALTLQWIDVDYDAKKIIFRSGKNAHIARDFYILEHNDKLLHSIALKGSHVFAVEGKQKSTDNFYQYVKHRLRRIGMGHLTPHGIRHSFANRAKADGVPIDEIQKFLGHKKIETTLMYINPNEAELRTSLAKISF